MYRKPTHTSQYLNFSPPPPQHKLCVIRTLTDRADTIVTTEEHKQQELNSVRKSLAICGNQDWCWNTIVRNMARDKQRIPRQGAPPSKGNVAIPYVSDLTESLQGLFRSHGINTYVKPLNTIRSLLVALLKDKANKFDIKNCGVVYQAACK